MGKFLHFTAEAKTAKSLTCHNLVWDTIYVSTLAFASKHRLPMRIYTFAINHAVISRQQSLVFHVIDKHLLCGRFRRVKYIGELMYLNAWNNATWINDHNWLWAKTKTTIVNEAWNSRMVGVGHSMCGYAADRGFGPGNFHAEEIPEMIRTETRSDKSCGETNQVR